MQSVHTPASPRAWQESGQSISIDGKFNTGARFPPRQHTKVEHPSMNQDHIKIRRTTSEVLNTATPTMSANLYDHLKVKSKRSKASANISKIRFTDGLRNAQYMDHPDTSNNITTPDMAGAWLKEKKSKQENPVIDKNNSSEDGKDIMPDRNEQYPSPRGTNNANGKTMPLLEHIFDTHSTKPAQKSDPKSCARSLSGPPVPLHLYKVGLVPVSDYKGGNLPAVPLQPSSTITHSKESTCLTTTRNSSKLPKPRRTFKPNHAKMASVLL